MDLPLWLVGLVVVSGSTADPCNLPQPDEASYPEAEAQAQPVMERWVELELMRLELDSLQRSEAASRRDVLSRRIQADQRALAADMDRILRVAARPPTCPDSDSTNQGAVFTP